MTITDRIVDAYLVGDVDALADACDEHVLVDVIVSTWQFQVTGRDEDFPVGLGGEAYVTGLEDHNHLRATWKGKSCEFDADFPRSPDPLPSLGTFVCHGVVR